MFYCKNVAYSIKYYRKFEMMSQDIGRQIHRSLCEHSVEKIIKINGNSYFWDIIGFVTKIIYQYDGSCFHVYACEANGRIKD